MSVNRTPATTAYPSTSTIFPTISLTTSTLAPASNCFRNDKKLETEMALQKMRKIMRNEGRISDGKVWQKNNFSVSYSHLGAEAQTQAKTSAENGMLKATKHLQQIWKNCTTTLSSSRFCTKSLWDNKIKKEANQLRWIYFSTMKNQTYSFALIDGDFENSLASLANHQKSVRTRQKKVSIKYDKTFFKLLPKTSKKRSSIYFIYLFILLFTFW